MPVCRVEPPFYRCHRTERAPLHFGRSGRSRFDDPLRQYGVLYLAADPHAAFVETFGNKTGAVRISESDIAERSLTVVGSWQPLTLVDLSGAGLARIGADARLFAADYGPAQAYSRALFDHPDRPTGILYPTRHDPSRLALALFQRDDLVLWTSTIGTYNLLATILASYGWALVPDESPVDT